MVKTILTCRLRKTRHEWVQEIHTHTRAVAGKSHFLIIVVYTLMAKQFIKSSAVWILEPKNSSSSMFFFSDQRPKNHTQCFSKVYLRLYWLCSALNSDVCECATMQNYKCNFQLLLCFLNTSTPIFLITIWTFKNQQLIWYF